VSEDKYGNRIALDGQVYVCGACGKRSRDLFGFQKISYGYDESCVLNAVLCHDDPEADRDARMRRGEAPWRAVTE
jgi:hypothetical protein